MRFVPSMAVALPLVVFAAGYLLNLLYITVFYHRGLTHGALTLAPWLRTVVVHSGSWITGLDVAGWVCLHRLHHAYADGPADPHSPRNVGLVGVALAQLRSYERVLIRLTRRDPELLQFVADLEFGVSWLNRRGLWWLPYAVHAGVGGLLAISGGWPLGLAYFAGMMSHPVQGWIVNSFGHAVGSRNFDTPDESRNNQLVAWLVGGEGLQNNHHAYPGSARFSYRWYEVDAGYAVCRLLQRLNWVRVRDDGLMPRARRVGRATRTVEAPR